MKEGEPWEGKKETTGRVLHMEKVEWTTGKGKDSEE